MWSNTNNKVAPPQAIHYVDAGSPHLVYLYTYFIFSSILILYLFFADFPCFFSKFLKNPSRLFSAGPRMGRRRPTATPPCLITHPSPPNTCCRWVDTGHHFYLNTGQVKNFWESLKTFYFPLNSHFCPQLNQWKDKVKGSIWEGWEDRRHRLTFPTFLTTFLSGIFSFQHER